MLPWAGLNILLITEFNDIAQNWYSNLPLNSYKWYLDTTSIISSHCFFHLRIFASGCTVICCCFTVICLFCILNQHDLKVWIIDVVPNIFRHIIPFHTWVSFLDMICWNISSHQLSHMVTCPRSPSSLQDLIKMLMIFSFLKTATNSLICWYESKPTKTDISQFLCWGILGTQQCLVIPLLFLT